MLDLQSKELKELSIKEFLGGIPEISLNKGWSHAEKMLEAVQAAADKVQPNREMQGPIFRVGEIIEIKGVSFELVGIGKYTLKFKIAK